MSSIADFKNQFAPRANWAHLNNAGQCLIPRGNRDLAQYWLNQFYEKGGHDILLAWETAEYTRSALAQFLGGSAEELAFFQTTASALSQAAAAIPLTKNDEILTWSSEYPSNFYPWRMAAERMGARLIAVDLDQGQTPIEKLLARVNSRTKAIAVSWIQYQNGSVTDLKSLSQALKGSGIWLVADIIQGAGVKPFHFHDSGFDIVCGGSHKWLCSGYGAAYMLVRKERLSQIQPLEFGAMTFGDPNTEKSFTIQPKGDARKFEPGSKAIIEVIAMQESLKLFNATGISAIFSEANRLASRLRAGLQDLGFQLFSGDGAIVNFAPNSIDKRDAIYIQLQAAQVDCVPRGQGIRLSIHAYNTDAEIDYVLGLLKKEKSY